MRSATRLVAAGVVVALAAGCGDRGPDFGGRPTVPAAVAVTHRGEPAAGAVVVFTPVGGATADAPGATGVAGPDGVARLTTYRDGDGAVAGGYVVSVTWPDEAARPAGDDDGRPAGDRPPGRDKLGGRYADPRASPLRRTVAEGVTELEPIKLP